MSKPKIEQIYHLSPSQQGMLYETVGAAPPGLHLEQLVWTWSGPLDDAALEVAWQRVVARHPSLRACFVWQEQSEPLQVVPPQVSVPFRRHDLRELPAADRRRALDDAIEADRVRGFKLARAPLLRLSLFRTADDQHELLWTFHHILLDGWCLPIVLEEVLAFYRAAGSGEEPARAAAPHFRDYVAWVRRQDPEAAQAFWSRRLRGFTRPTPLGVEELAGGPESGPGVRRFRLSSSATTALQALARRQCVTMSTVLQGSWGLLLHRFSGTADVVFGVTVSGRPAELEGIERMVGSFINTVPVRLRIELGCSLWPYLQELQEHSGEQQAFEHCSAGQIQSWSEVPGASPLYESIIVFESYPMEVPGVRLAELRSIGARTRYPLVIIAVPGSELELRIIYDGRRMDAAAADRVGEALLSVLGCAAAGIDDPRVLLAPISGGAIPRIRPAPALPSDPVTTPRSATERRLAAIWSELLGLPQIAVGDSFFALGGHSLLAARLVGAVNAAFAVSLPLVTLFESPTLAALAARIDSTQTAGPSASSSLGDELPRLTPAPAQRFEPFPLTDIQQAYWVGRSGFYELGRVSTHIYFELDGQGLDLGRIERAWQRLVERHDMLRAIILPDGSQRVLPEVPRYRIEVLDLTAQPAASRGAALEAVRSRMSHQVLPADKWPLFEIRMSLLPDGATRLHVGLDALIADAWSMFLLFQEWSLLYAWPAQVLPPLALGFRDYVLAEQQLRDSELYRRARDYWMGRLDTLPPAPDLPRVADAVEDGRFRRRSGRLSPTAWSQLQQRTARLGLTPSAALCAAFAEVLAAFSRNPRFTLNLTLFHRLPLHEQVNEVVGDFTSLTLLETHMSELEPFAARALRLQQQLWQDLDHRHFSGVQVLRELARRQGGSRRALMPIVFTSTLALGADGRRTSLLGPFGELSYAVGQTPQVCIDHQVIEHDGALLFNWDAVEALFPPGLLDDLFDSYCRLLTELVESETRWHQSLRGVIPPLHLALQASTNATFAPIPETLLHAPFFAQAAQKPDAIAVVAPERTLTYDELAARARRLGHRLRRSGARPEALIAVVAERGWEPVVGVLGILAAGAAYVPIDPSLPEQRRLLLLAQSGAKLVVTTRLLDGTLRWPLGIEKVCIDEDELTAPDPGPLEPVATPSNLAYVIFTSGSTGNPKGVMIEHRSAANTIVDVSARFGVSKDDRVLALSDLGFDLSVYDIFGVLAVGGAIVIPAESDARDAIGWLALMRRHRVTMWNTVPALMQLLVDHLDASPVAPPPGLRLVLLSGDWIPVKLPDRIKALWPAAQVISLGGATEASIWSIAHPIDRVDPGWKSIPYGKPLANQRFYVLDDFLEPAPVLVTGHLYIGGIGITRGYWGDPVRTQASLIEHPRTFERLYRTGDLGRYLRDGEIEFLGRADLQVKINGYRIELGEIEAALNQHPAVKEAIVDAVGERHERRQLVAYVVPAEAADELYEVSRADPAQAAMRWQALVSAGLARAHSSEGDVPRAAFAALFASLDELYISTLLSALRALGAFTTPDARHDADDLMGRCRIAPRYRRWLDRGLAALVEADLLAHDGCAFTARAIVEPETGALFARVRTELEAALGFGSNESTWFLDSVAQLPRLLAAGERSAEVYASSATIEVYRKLFKRCNEILAAAVHAVVAAIPAGDPLRILEVGAGYGSTTEHVLPLLSPARTRYTFTDISRFFLTEAKEKLSSYGFVEYTLLDLDRSPASQGFSPLSFDVVIASSVLHDTRSLRASLGHLRELLSPGGILLIIEETRFFRSFDLGMGLQQGFDRFEDTELRAHHPLLPREGWQALLVEAGFSQVAVLDREGSSSDFAGFDVLVAQAPLRAARFNSAALRAHLAQKLPEYMVPPTYVILDALPLSRNGKVDRAALPTPSADRRVERSAPVAPRTPTEVALAALWAHMLQLDQVGIHDPFFEIGGDSLVAARLATHVRQAYGVALPLRRLYEAPTVAALSTYIDTVVRAQQRTPASLGADDREEGVL